MLIKSIQSLALCVALLAPGLATAADFVIVRNAGNPTVALTRDELKKMLMGQMKNWTKDGPVQVVLRPKGSPEMKWLSETVFGVNEDILRTKIGQEVFKGELRKPIEAASVADGIAVVQGNAGAFIIMAASDAAGLPSTVAVIPAP